MMAFFKPETAANSDQVMRVALAPLAALAARSGASVLLVRPLTKHGGRKAIYRGGGSIGIIGAGVGLPAGGGSRPAAGAMAGRVRRDGRRPVSASLPRHGAGSGHGGRMAAGGAGGWAAAGEGKADRPPSRAVSALRPWEVSPFGERKPGSAFAQIGKGRKWACESATLAVTAAGWRPIRAPP